MDYVKGKPRQHWDGCTGGFLDGISHRHVYMIRARIQGTRDLLVVDTWIRITGLPRCIFDQV